MDPQKTYSRILVLQTAFLGDAIVSTPLLRALKQVFPAAELDVLCIPSTAPVFATNPHVRDVLTFSKHSFLSKTAGFLRLAARVRKRNYRLGISIQSSLTSSMLMKAGGIPERLGFKRQKYVTMRVPHVNTRGLHKREKIMALMQPFSEAAFGLQTELHWGSEEERNAGEILNKLPAGTDKKVGIAPGSVWPTKRWPEEYFAELVRDLAAQGLGVVLIGGERDRGLCARIGHGTGAVNAAGELRVLGSAALIKRLDLLVTNDSAPLHIGNAVNTTVVAIFGPTTRRFGFFPFGPNDEMLEMDLDCRPCGKHGHQRCPLGHHNCMRRISADQVERKVLKKLGEGS